MSGAELALAPPIATRMGRWRRRRPPVRLLVDAMLTGDVIAADDLAQQFLARSGSRVAVFADLLQPAQYEIGDMWYRGHAGMEDEHRAAGVLARLVDELPPTPARSPVRAGSRCLLTAPPDERHTLGLRMFAAALEDDGWEVELLDRDYELEQLPGLVQRVRPRLVGISAGCLPATQGLAHAIAGIRAMQVPVLVGGGAFNRASDLWRRLGASGHGADARIGAVLARRLTRS